MKDTILKDTYVHIGTSHIKKDLWYNVQNRDKKPIGGLWTSPYIEDCICEWLDFVGEHPERFSKDFIKEGCFITIKEDSKIYKMDSVKEFIQLYQYYNKHIDFEDLSRNYDVMYVNPCVSREFSNWDVRTLYILNIEAIKNYTPFDIKAKQLSPYYVHYEVDQIGLKTQVEAHSELYYEVYEMFLEKYKKILSLEEVKKLLLENCKQDFSYIQDLYLICDALVENEYQKKKINKI